MELKIQSRDVTGKKVKSLRKQGLVPAVIYGHHMENAIMISFDKNDFLSIYRKGGSSTTITLKGDKINELALVQDIQLDPVTDYILHVDMLAVKADEKVEVEVPVILTGVSSVEKLGLGRVQLIRDTIDVEALPQDLPHDVSIDISKIESINDVVFVRDLELSDKIEITTDPDQVLVTVVALNDDVEEETEEVATGAADEKAEAKAPESKE